jgi:hypothetical protein
MLPDSLDPATTMLALYDPYYPTDMVPINDNIYVYLNGDLRYTGGTSYWTGTPCCAGETDGWHVAHSISLTALQPGLNVIDVITEDYAGSGGLGYLQLRNGDRSESCRLGSVPWEPTPATNTPSYSDPAPVMSTAPGEIVLRKELSGWAGYGAPDGRADILGSNQAATWSFALPPSIDRSRIRGAYFRVATAADDHYDVDINRYTLFTWTSSQRYVSHCLVHGAPWSQRFDNWRIFDYQASLSAGDYPISLANRSFQTASGDWIAVDWIELHLIIGG